MSVQVLGLKEINGPLVVLDNVEGVGYDEMAEVILTDGSRRLGRVVQIEGKRVVLQVFQGTSGSMMVFDSSSVLESTLRWILRAS